MMKCSGSSLVAVLVIAACMTGQASAQSTPATSTACDDPTCELCEQTNTGFCLQCNSDFGYALQDSTSGLCAPCDTTCYQCGPTVTTCSSCNLAGQGPVRTSATGACADCSGNCTICDTAGSGKCDPTGCNTKFALNIATQQCERCPGANCPGCTDPSVCPTCNSGYGLQPPNKFDVKTDCRKCTVLHAEECSGDYQQVDVCLNDGTDYGVDSTNTQCYPICAIIPRTEWFSKSAPAPTGRNFPSLPNRIIVHETKTRMCHSYSDCIKVVNGIYKVQTTDQDFRPLFNLRDISYNILIGGDGSIFEGTGLQKIGSHTNPKQNPISIGAAFIGSFTNEGPKQAALDALGRFVSTTCLTQNAAYLSDNFVIKTHWDVDCSFCPPGKLRNAIKDNANFTALYRTSSTIETNCKESGGRKWKHTL
jgi:hypothetical protein